MLWNEESTYLREPFELEADLEEAVQLVAGPLFGPDRYYLDVKKRIARRGGRGNVPDGYLVDLTSRREPRLYVVENELARHEPLKHIAVQILEFSLAFDRTVTDAKIANTQRTGGRYWTITGQPEGCGAAAIPIGSSTRAAATTAHGLTSPP